MEQLIKDKNSFYLYYEMVFIVCKKEIQKQKIKTRNKLNVNNFIAVVNVGRE